MTAMTRKAIPIMIRVALFLCVAFAFSGCASVSHPLPKCDGYSRRPLNRSMWQWQKNNPEQKHAGPVQTDPASRASAYVEEQSVGPPSPFASFNVAGSYHRCAG